MIAGTAATAPDAIVSIMVAVPVPRMHSLAKALMQPSVHIWIREDDRAFIAKCLDIPGCESEGATRGEALANIHDAIRLCLDVIEEDSEKSTALPENIEIIENRSVIFRRLNRSRPSLAFALAINAPET